LSFGYGMMQRGVALDVCSIQRAPVLEEKLNDGHRANCGCAVDSILPTAVAHTSRSSRFILK
jgi:hypothetical protein